MNIKAKFFLLLYKAFRFIEIKRILKVRSACRIRMLYRIQLFALKTFPDKKFAQIHIFSCAFLDKLLGETVHSESSENILEFSDDIDALYDKFKDDQQLNKDAADYYLVHIFIFSSLPEKFSTSFENEISAKLSKAKNYYPDAKMLLDHNALNNLFSRLKKQIKALKKEVRVLHKELINNDYESSINKISIERQSVMFIITLCSTMFVASGYFYVTNLLNHFGVDASYFFTISDYLGVSLDKIYITLVSSLIGIVFALFMLSSDHKEEIRADYYEIEPRKLISDRVLFVSILMLSGSLIYHTWIDSSIQSKLFDAVLFFLAVLTLARLPLYKYIKNYAPIYFTLLILIIFGFTLKSNISIEIAKIESSIAEEQKYSFSYKEANLYKNKALVFIFGNSEYLFFYSKTEKAVYIIPSDEISQIKTLVKYRDAN